ncbi:general transcription repressor [Malassezia sp. CBS 17886]|nr:general transcription repressor [Malassezia sp. CBS 17886]
MAPSQSLQPHVPPHTAASPPPTHPLAGAPAGPPAGSQSIWSSRLLDLLNLVRHEFDVVGNDAVHFKAQRDELEHRMAQQFSEVGLMQDHIYELEKRHYEIVAHYEDEIARLRAALDVRGQPMHDAPMPTGPMRHAPVVQRGASPGHVSHYERDPRERPVLPDRGHRAPASGSFAALPPQDWPPAKRAKTANGSGGAQMPPQDARPRLKREEREVDARRAHAAAPDWQDDEAAGAAHGGRGGSLAHGRSDEPGERTPARSPPVNGGGDAERSMEIKKEGSDWVAIYNPKVKPALDVNLVHTFTHDSVVCCVRFSPDGRYLATGCNRSAQIYDVKSGAKTSVLQDTPSGGHEDLYIRSVCFSPDGKYLATGTEDRQIHIWDIAERKVKMLLSGHKQEIYSIEYSQDGRILASGSGDKTVRIWDMDTGEAAHVFYTSPGLNYGPGVTTIAISPDGRLVAAGALDTFIRIWDTKTGHLRCRLKGHKDSIYSVCFTPDGKTLVSGSLDKTLKLWDMSGIVNAADVIEDEITSSVCINTLVGHKDYVLSVSCSPDGRWIASGSKDRCVQFWDPATAQTQFVLQGHKNSVIAINLSQQSNLLATGSGDFNARIWSYADT